MKKLPAGAEGNSAGQGQGQTQQQNNKGTLTVTIISSDQDTPIEGASVKLGTTTKTTNAQGQTSFDEIEYVDQEVEVSAENHTTKTETLAFRSNHKTFTVTMQKIAGSSVDEGQGDGPDLGG